MVSISKTFLFLSLVVFQSHKKAFFPTTSFKIAEPPDCVLYPRRNMSFGDKISWSNIANYLNFLPKKVLFQ